MTGNIIATTTARTTTDYCCRYHKHGSSYIFGGMVVSWGPGHIFVMSMFINFCQYILRARVSPCTRVVRFWFCGLSGGAVTRCLLESCLDRGSKVKPPLRKLSAATMTPDCKIANPSTQMIRSKGAGCEAPGLCDTFLATAPRASV